MKRYIVKFSVLMLFFSLPAFNASAQKKKTDSDVLLKQIKTEMDVNRNYTKALSLSRSAVEQFPNDVDFRFYWGVLIY